MNTGPDERLPFLELARQGARVERSLPAAQLPRLAQIAPGVGELQLELAFSLDGDGRPWVSGSAVLSVEATCQRCLEDFEHDMRVPVKLCIVVEQTLASELADSVDVLVAQGETVSLADVVEDEIILRLPERLCTEEPCWHAPPMWYPAPDAAEPQRDENPFAVLSELKK
jgi:uncharacterized protein